MFVSFIEDISTNVYLRIYTILAKMGNDTTSNKLQREINSSNMILQLKDITGVLSRRQWILTPDCMVVGLCIKLYEMSSHDSISRVKDLYRH
jgi:hypothetical protein